MIELGNKCDLVPLSHALRVGQRDKPHKSGTARGTSAGQVSLKSLAINVLKRDKARDSSGTRPGQKAGQDTPFCPTSCPTPNDRNRQFFREVCSTHAGHVFPSPDKPNPWPVLWHLVEHFNCNPLMLDQWPASVVLCFAPGVLASEKQCALRYAVDHWQALLEDMALPADGSIRHCWVEGYEYLCRPGNVKEAAAC